MRTEVPNLGMEIPKPLLNRKEITFLRIEWRARKDFEPLTPRFVVWCSIQLSYGRRCEGMEACSRRMRCIRRRFLSRPTA